MRDQIYVSNKFALGLIGVITMTLLLMFIPVIMSWMSNATTADLIMDLQAKGYHAYADQDGNFDIDGDLEVDGDADIGGDLNVTGSITGDGSALTGIQAFTGEYTLVVASDAPASCPDTTDVTAGIIVCPGSGSDSASIQTAIGLNKPIKFTTGHYYIDTQLTGTNNMTMFSDSRYGAILVTQNGIGNSKSIINCTGVENISLYGFTLDGNKSGISDTENKCLTLNDVDGFYLNDLFITNSQEKGVLLDGSYNGTIGYIETDGTGNHAFQISNGSHDIAIGTMVCNNSGVHDIAIAHGSIDHGAPHYDNPQSDDEYNYNITINTLISNSPDQSSLLLCDARDVVVMGGISSNASSTLSGAISITGDLWAAGDSCIKNCTISNFDIYSPASNGIMAYDFEGLTLSDCTVNNITNSTKYAYYLVDQNTKKAESLSMSNCNAYGCPAWARFNDVSGQIDGCNAYEMTGNKLLYLNGIDDGGQLIFKDFYAMEDDAACAGGGGDVYYFNSDGPGPIFDGCYFGVACLADFQVGSNTSTPMAINCFNESGTAWGGAWIYP